MESWDGAGGDMELMPEKEVGTAGVDRTLITLLRGSFERPRPAQGGRSTIPVEPPDLCELTEVLRRARQFEVAPLVAREIMSLPVVAPAARLAAERIYTDNLARNLYLGHQTERWVDLMKRAGIPCRPIKGVRTALRLYGDPGVKTIADIDLLVRRRDLTRAEAVAAREGFKSTGSDLIMSDPESKSLTLVPVDGARPYCLDLHWRIEGPLLLPIDHEPFWGDAEVGREDLPPELLGVLLSLHLWRHAVTLKTLCDFAGFVRRHDEEIPSVASRLARAGTRRGLILALADRVLAVRSRHLPRRAGSAGTLGRLERCLLIPAKARGRYFKWLVFPLQFDGPVLTARRLASHLFRSVPDPSRFRLISRVRRLGGVAAGLTLSREPFVIGEADHGIED